MDSFLIKGGVPLHGEVSISGSKNAALPIMASTLLTDEPCVIRRVPDLSDTRFMVKILESLGATAKFENGTLTIHAKKIKGYADYELVISVAFDLFGMDGQGAVFELGARAEGFEDFHHETGIAEIRHTAD